MALVAEPAAARGGEPRLAAEGPAGAVELYALDAEAAGLARPLVRAHRRVGATHGEKPGLGRHRSPDRWGAVNAIAAAGHLRRARGSGGAKVARGARAAAGGRPQPRRQAGAPRVLLAAIAAAVRRGHARKAPCCLLRPHLRAAAAVKGLDLNSSNSGCARLVSGVAPISGWLKKK